MNAESWSCNFPVWAIPYFVNCDDTGISQRDKRQVDRFLEGVAEDGFDISNYTLPDDIARAKYFTAFPQFGRACECVNLTFYKVTGENE